MKPTPAGRRGEQPVGGRKVRAAAQVLSRQPPSPGQRGHRSGQAREPALQPPRKQPQQPGPWVEQSPLPSPGLRWALGQPSSLPCPALPSGALGQCLRLPACQAWNCWVLLPSRKARRKAAARPTPPTRPCQGPPGQQATRASPSHSGGPRGCDLHPVAGCWV